MANNPETIVPYSKSVVNAFDYIGLLLGLPRLPNERNVEYKSRLGKVFSQPAGASASGLINGITRELGLEQYDAIVVSSTSTDFPRILVTDSKVKLYSDYRDDVNYVLDAEIDIYTRDGTGYYYTDLVAAINATTYFTAALSTGVDGHTLSGTLLRADSRTWSTANEIKPFKKFYLGETDIVDGTLSFSSGGISVFTNEVVLASDVVADGDYYVDYTNGWVTCYSLPNKATTCNFQYNEVPLTLCASPVMLYEFGSEEFRENVFNRISLEDGTTIDGMPTGEAVDYINELLGAKPMLWGK